MALDSIFRPEVLTLGAPQFPSPVDRYIPESITLPDAGNNGRVIEFERAGPRSRIYFRPQDTRVAIVTCGGICPGLNNVIRAVLMELEPRYGVRDVIGIRYGYAGMDPANGWEPLPLNAEMVEDIHRNGGSILGTSRGPVDPEVALDWLISRDIDILFCVGGDGTMRGAHALHLAAAARGYKLGVIGIPKTIDNDIEYVWRSFGYQTAVDEAARVIAGAHQEAKSHYNGIGLVKLMGRDAGFIAAGATVASGEVNFTLIPEVPFELRGPNGFLEVLKKRMKKRHHAVIVVAEGAGQELMAGSPPEFDASGNPRYRDIGNFLNGQIQHYFRDENVPVTVKYFDPSYLIRSRPANCDDNLLCNQYGRNAVHAAMAGKTDMLIGLWFNVFVHVPIPLAIARKRSMSPTGELWGSVLAATGQQPVFGELTLA
jgi:6-phosphofructokinase 1